MELRWWRENLAGVHGKDMVTSEELSRFEVSFAGDTSGVGANLRCLNSGTMLLSFPFSPEEACQSSTFHELLVLSKFDSHDKSNYLGGRSVLHMTDNQAVMYIMSGGSNKPILQELCRQVFLACRAKGIVLKME